MQGVFFICFLKSEDADEVFLALPLMPYERGKGEFMRNSKTHSITIKRKLMFENHNLSKIVSYDFTKISKKMLFFNVIIKNACISS